MNKCDCLKHMTTEIHPILLHVFVTHMAVILGLVSFLVSHAKSKQLLALVKCHRRLAGAEDIVVLKECLGSCSIINYLFCLL